MTNIYEAAQQALDALESRCGTNAEERGPGGVIEALRSALAKQGEPVAYVKFRNGEVDYDCDDNRVISNTPGDAMTDEIEWRAVFTAAPAAQRPA